MRISRKRQNDFTRQSGSAATLPKVFFKNLEHVRDRPNTGFNNDIPVWYNVVLANNRVLAKAGIAPQVVFDPRKGHDETV